MSLEKPRLYDYLGHMLEAIERICRYTQGMDEAAFLDNEMVQDEVIRNFENLGEASRNIAVQHPAFAAAHPELPLDFAYKIKKVARRNSIWLC